MEDQRAEEIWWENEWLSGRNPSRSCGCPMNRSMPYSSYNPDELAFLGALLVRLCGCQAHKQKTDCFFFSKENDVGSTIPTCSYHNKGLEHCPCEGCKTYISKDDVYKMAKDSVDKNR